MPNYQQSKIYKIIDNTGTYSCYIGSTCQKYWQDRISSHRSKTKFNNNNCMSDKIIKLNDWSAELLENYPCNNVYELREREQYWIDNNDCINKMSNEPFDKKAWSKNSRRLHKDWGNLLKIKTDIFQ